MKRLSLLFAALTLFTVSCTENISEPTNTGGISGFVVDKTTGDPVQTVNVKLKETGASTVTGSDGSFSFQHLENGEYTVLLSKEGYNNNSNTIRVTNGRIVECHITIERIPAVLTIDREVLDFGDNYSNTTLSFSMVNKNYVDLDWEIVHNCRWIKEIDPEKSITKLSFGKTQTVVVIIDRELLQPGNNETVIVVRTSDGATELTVKAIGQEKRLAALNIAETTEIKASSAILNAVITDGGVPTYSERGFVLGDSEMPTRETAIKVIPAAVNNETAFSARVGDLVLGSTYYVRAYATNSIGTAYSTNQNIFSTVAVLPTVSTLTATSEDRGTKSAVLRGTISYEGDPSYKERGFVWSNVFENPTIEENKIVVSGSGVGNYEKRVTFSDISKTIFYRAYATNQQGTAYGESFKIFIPDYIILNSNLGVQKSDLTSNSLLIWDDANNVCTNSRVSGLNDWRLPTKDELYYLYTLRNEIGGFVVNNSRWSVYWTSTPAPELYPILNYKQYYYEVNFYNGQTLIGIGDSDDATYRWGNVRCVRSLE